MRERAEGARRRARRPRRDLHGHGAGAADRDARVHAHRRGALGRVRRLLVDRARRPHRRRGVQGADHLRRRLAARPGRAAEGPGRRGGRALPESIDHVLVRAPHRERGGRGPRAATSGGTTRCADASRRLRAGADGRRGRAVPALHERHDGEAEGHLPHHRRLPARRDDDPPVGVRHPPRRRLLVRGRLRLGDRPLVHRLRPAREPHHRRHVRGHARAPDVVAALGDHRAPRRHASTTRRRPRSARS